MNSISNQMSELPRILIVDDSRMVRASIMKHVRSDFDVREEADGEAGWGTLLIDPEIKVVICDLSMPRLSGYGLLERARASKITRIRDMPVIMISGDEDESARSRAKQLGATDFITKGIGTAELLSRLETLVKLSKTNEALEKSSADAALDPVTGLLSRKMLLRNCDQQFSYAQRHQVEMSVLVVGIDRYEERVLKHGPELAEEFLAKFAELLQASVRTEDVLATFGSNQFAIVSAGTQVKAASLFALRLCEAVAAATISHRSRPLRLTVSIGIANSAADTVAEATALLTLAETRMDQAMQAGGNRILGVGGVPVSRRREEDGPRDIDHALARLAVGDVDSVRLQLATLTDRLMPFLRLIEYDYGVALPLAELERIIASNKASE